MYDLYFSQNGELCGVRLDAKGLWRKGKVIPIEEIVNIGEDAVTVRTDTMISSLSAEHEFLSMMDGNRLKGKPVVTTNGSELGIVEDVYFEEKLGKIVAYELSDGFLSDVTEGREVLPLQPQFVIGDDAIIVPQETSGHIG